MIMFFAANYITIYQTNSYANLYFVPLIRIRYACKRFLFFIHQNNSSIVSREDRGIYGSSLYSLKNLIISCANW